MGGERQTRRGKRRFGVSIPEHLARDLDELGTKMSIERSRLVEEAVRVYIRDHKHHLYPHKCRGLLIVQTKTSSCLWGEINSIMEKHREIVRFSIHFHIDDDCLDIFVTEGESNEVSLFHQELMGLKGTITRYVPLSRLE